MHYVANVTSECFKSKSGVARVAMRMRSEAPRVACQRWQRLGSAGPVWACETQAQVGACCFFSSAGVDCWDEHEKQRRGHLDVGPGPNIHGLGVTLLLSFEAPYRKCCLND
jgi:hypothetical protein